MKVGGNPPIPPGDEGRFLKGSAHDRLEKLAKEILADLSKVARVNLDGPSGAIEQFFKDHSQEISDNLALIQGKLQKLKVLEKADHWGTADVDQLSKDIDTWQSQYKKEAAAGELSYAGQNFTCQLYQNLDTVLKTIIRY